MNGRELDCKVMELIQLVQNRFQRRQILGKIISEKYFRLTYFYI
jgi:hypothetical protein